MVDRSDLAALLGSRGRRRPRANDDDAPDGFPMAGTRAQAVQRLQIGFGGVIMMFLLVGLASIIERRADEVDAVSVPEAAPTVEPSEPSGGDDPLVTAGVVPDLPDDPSPTPTQSPAVVPEAGAAPPLEE